MFVQHEGFFLAWSRIFICKRDYYTYVRGEKDKRTITEACYCSFRWYNRAQRNGAASRFEAGAHQGTRGTFCGL